MNIRRRVTPISTSEKAWNDALAFLRAYRSADTITVTDGSEERLFANGGWIDPLWASVCQPSQTIRLSHLKMGQVGDDRRAV